MTYNSGGLIQATDYNGFVSTNGSNLNAVWNTAYGQGAIGTVATGGLVTATQWATLNNSLAAAAAHQGTTITSRTSPSAGDLITILSNLNTDITNINSNVYNAASSGAQYTGWTGTASKTTATGSGASPWIITFVDTITFASASAANYFFSAGGLIKIQFSKTSTGTVADTEWNNFIGTLCGTIYLSSTAASKTINGQAYTGTTKIGGTGTPTVLATGSGFQQLSTSPTTLYQQYDVGSAYSGNYLAVVATWDGSTTLTITTYWNSAGDGAAGSTAQISGGTATTGISFGTAPATVVTYIPPETTHLTNSWGTPTVASTVT